MDLVRPDTVIVLGQPFAITWVDNDDPLARHGQVGRTQTAQQKISLDATIGEDQQKDTLLHEMLHASLRILGFDISDKLEERVIAAMTPVLLDMLRANPQVTKWLTA